MNLPNKLTVSRLVLTLVFVIIVFANFSYGYSIALALFVVASITDYLDGWIARREKLITNFGILMDPLADKILVCSAFIAFVGLGLMPAWMVVVIVTRELAITGLRLLAASKQVVLAAEGYGKHKTVSQLVAIVAILLLMSYHQWGEAGRAFFGYPLWGKPWLDHFALLSKWFAVLLTLVSGSMYLWRNRRLYLQDM